MSSDFLHDPLRSSVAREPSTATAPVIGLRELTVATLGVLTATLTVCVVLGLTSPSPSLSAPRSAVALVLALVCSGAAWRLHRRPNRPGPSGGVSS